MRNLIVMGAPGKFILLVKLLLSNVFMPEEEDVEMVEYFSGKKAVTEHWKREGHMSMPYDIVEDGALCDINRTNEFCWRMCYVSTMACLMRSPAFVSCAMFSLSYVRNLEVISHDPLS